MFHICKINNYSKALYYSSRFSESSKIDLPIKYLAKNESYLFYNSQGLIGGFSLAKNNKRVIRQIPEHIRKYLSYIDDNSLEITGYFIRKKEKAFLMVLFFLWKIITSKAKWFVYAYDKDNHKVGSIYAKANPICLYSGKVENLHGMIGDHFENIELITKSGFLRIWVSRILRRMQKQFTKKDSKI